MGSHLTTRDVSCANFINRTNLHMTSSQIARLFYKTASKNSSKTVANRRLAIMIEKRQLKRVRQYVSQEFIYYSKSLPAKLEHKQLMVEFLCKLRDSGVHFDLETVETEVCTWQKDYNIRPDMLMIIENSNGEKFHLIVECDFSKKFTADKYSNFIDRRLTDPAILNIINNRLIIVSVCKTKPEPIKLSSGQVYKPVWVSSDFSNISNIAYLFIKK